MAFLRLWFWNYATGCTFTLRELCFFVKSFLTCCYRNAWIIVATWNTNGSGLTVFFEEAARTNLLRHTTLHELSWITTDSGPVHRGVSGISVNFGAETHTHTQTTSLHTVIKCQRRTAAMEPSGILIRGGNVVNEECSAICDVYIEKGKIVEVGVNLQIPAGVRVIDATDKLVIPGGIDTHTHMELAFMGTKAVDDFYIGTKVCFKLDCVILLLPGAFKCIKLDRYKWE